MAKRKAKKKAKKRAKKKSLTSKAKRIAKTKSGRTGIGAGAGALLLGPIGAVGGALYGASTAKGNPDSIDGWEVSRTDKAGSMTLSDGRTVTDVERVRLQPLEGIRDAPGEGGIYVYGYRPAPAIARKEYAVSFREGGVGSRLRWDVLPRVKSIDTAVRAAVKKLNRLSNPEPNVSSFEPGLGAPVAIEREEEESGRMRRSPSPGHRLARVPMRPREVAMADTRPVDNPTVGQRGRMIAKVLHGRQGPMSTNKIGNETGLSDTEVASGLNWLRHHGWVQKSGEGYKLMRNPSIEQDIGTLRRRKVRSSAVSGAKHERSAKKIRSAKVRKILAANPLAPGPDSSAIHGNIRELIHAGVPQQQACAAAYEHARATSPAGMVAPAPNPLDLSTLRRLNTFQLKKLGQYTIVDLGKRTNWKSPSIFTDDRQTIYVMLPADPDEATWAHPSLGLVELVAIEGTGQVRWTVTPDSKFGEGLNAAEHFKLVPTGLRATAKIPRLSDWQRLLERRRTEHEKLMVREQKKRGERISRATRRREKGNPGIKDRKRKGYTIQVADCGGEFGFEASHPEHGSFQNFGYPSASSAFGAANRDIDKRVGLRLTRAFFDNPKKKAAKKKAAKKIKPQKVTWTKRTDSDDGKSFHVSSIIIRRKPYRWMVTQAGRDKNWSLILFNAKTGQALDVVGKYKTPAVAKTKTLPLRVMNPEVTSAEMQARLDRGDDPGARARTRRKKGLTEIPEGVEIQRVPPGRAEGAELPGEWVPARQTRRAIPKGIGVRASNPRRGKKNPPDHTRGIWDPYLDAREKRVLAKWMRSHPAADKKNMSAMLKWYEQLYGPGAPDDPVRALESLFYSLGRQGSGASQWMGELADQMGALRHCQDGTRSGLRDSGRDVKGNPKENPHHEAGSPMARSMDPERSYSMGVITDPDALIEVEPGKDRSHVLAVRVGNRWANVHPIRRESVIAKSPRGQKEPARHGYGVRWWMTAEEIREAKANATYVTGDVVAKLYRPRNPSKAKKKATKKKTVRKPTPEWQRLTKRCQKLWESYCERPGKKRLRLVLAHLEKMKSSTSAKVRAERSRCLRAAKAEAKKLKMKL